MNCLFDTARVVIRVTVNKLYFVPEWLVSGVVGMLWNIYRAKTSTLIENGPHQLLNKDSTDRLTCKVSEKLLTLKRRIRPRHKQPDRIYGLLRIHKADVPLRPIVSCVNTFAYDLSAYLANILSPLTGKSEYTVTNSAHFVSTVSNETILDNEIMVSFDVELLFTNVPIDAAVQAALQKLEEQAITTLSYDPRIWKRYVDNTFTILDRLPSASPWRQRKITNSPSWAPQF